MRNKLFLKTLTVTWILTSLVYAGDVGPIVAFDGYKSKDKSVEPDMWLVCDTTLRILPDGRWAIYMLAGGVTEPSPENFIGVTYSTDQGRNWSKLVPVSTGFPREGKTKGQGPTEVFTANNRTYMFFATHSWTWGENWKSWYMHSDDCGKTWSKALPLPGRLADRTFIRPAIFSKHKAGRIILPFQYYLGHESGLVPPIQDEKSSADRWDILRKNVSNSRNGVLVSDDGGETWKEHGDVRLPLPANVHLWAEPSIVELKDGSIVMFIRPQWSDKKTLYKAVSKDGGVTWPEVAEKTDIPNPSSKIALFSLGGDKVAMIHNPNPIDRKPIALWISSDGTQTWEYQRVLIPESMDGPKGKLNYPEGFVSADGKYLHFAIDDNRHRAVYYGAKLPE